MTAFPHSACFFLWAVFLLSLADAAPAPVAEGDLAQSQALEYHTTEAGSSRCYYNFQHYEEGDRIVTNEPCLNCTCHKRMLMCYLRVCPFTKPVGQDCTVEKKPDQCCPVITCPEVRVDIVVSSTTESATSSAVGHVSKYGCTLEDNTFYPDGVQMPSDPKKPCELCYCIRNHTACVRQECTLNVEGCRPVYQDGVCCPVRYDCDYNEISTTERPSTGGLMLGTTASPSQQCHYGDTVYNDGELIETDKPCESCYCMRGDIVCAVRSCGEPMEGKDCHAMPPLEGQCCPSTYECANGTISIDALATESSIIMHPSPVETEEPTKGPEPQPPVEETSDTIEEETPTDKKDEEAVPTTEVLPSDSPKEEEKEPEKNEEEAVEDHPVEHILSEPTDSDDTEEEEEIAAIPEHPEHVTGTPHPEISEHIATSGPDTSENIITDPQSNLISQETSSENSESPVVGPGDAESDKKEIEAVTESEKQESVDDKIKPSEDSESAGTETEKVTGQSESENQENITGVPGQLEETSQNKLEDETGHDIVTEDHHVAETTDAEVLTESITDKSEHPEEPIPAGESDQTETAEKTDEAASTPSKEEEKLPTSPVSEEGILPENNDLEDSKTNVSENPGVEQEDTQTESHKVESSTGEPTVESEQKPETENESPTTNENEIKFEETPSKTPESLDQVKETEVLVEKDTPSTIETASDDVSGESVATTDQDKQEPNHHQVEAESVPAEPSVPSEEGTESSEIPVEEAKPIDTDHFPKEPVPPRKEDAAPEEPEQRPQHAEGSMTKAEDSIPVDQAQTEAVVTELPEKIDESEKNEAESPTEVEKEPIDTADVNIKQDGTEESIDSTKPQGGENHESSEVQTEPTSSEAPTEHSLPAHETSQTSESPESQQTNETEDKISEPVTDAAADDVESESATDEIKPTESPEKEESGAISEGDLVPTVIVIEPESESSPDSVPEESIQGEVIPESLPSTESPVDASHDHEEGHQSLQTENPVGEEEETTLKEVETQPLDNEKLTTAGESVPNETTSPESTQNQSEDHTKEEATEQSSEIEEPKPSEGTLDDSTSPDTVDIDSENVTPTEGHSGAIPEKTEEETTHTPQEAAVSPEESSPSTETIESSVPENDVGQQSQQGTSESENLPNEIRPEESDKHKESQTEPSVSEESSTDILTKLGSESKPDKIDDSKNGEETSTESKPVEPSASDVTPESQAPSEGTEEVQHDPVESEPTEFDDHEFEETDDHESASENEIIDDHHPGHGGSIEHEKPSITPGPIGIIPGEGDCLVDGETYTNNSKIPSKSPCHKECICLSSIVHCQGIDCPPPPPELANCMPVHQGELCCPVYTCDGHTPEGPKPHNQMGATEDTMKETEEQTPSSSDHGSTSDVPTEPEEVVVPEQPSGTQEGSEVIHTPEQTNFDSEVHEEVSEHPLAEEESGTQDGKDQEKSPPAEETHENPEVEKPEETNEKSESSTTSVLGNGENTSSPYAETEEHANDDKHSIETATTIVEANEEAKPESEVSPTQVVPSDEVKEPQPTVFTDQSETHEVESQEPAGTEASVLEVSPSKPEETNVVSDEVSPTIISEHPDQPHEDVSPETEVSQPSTDATTEVDENKESESTNEGNNTQETGNQEPSEVGIGDHLVPATEKVTLPEEEITDHSKPEEQPSEGGEINTEQTASHDMHEDHVPSEGGQPSKEAESSSTESPIDESESTEESQKTEQTPSSPHISDETSSTDENIEHEVPDVHDIVTETSSVNSEVDTVKEDMVVTQEHSDSEVVVTNKPNKEEASQEADETSASDSNIAQSESEAEQSTEEVKPQTLDTSSEVAQSEDTSTELVQKPTESSLGENLPSSAGEESAEGEKEVAPTDSTAGEVLVISEQKPSDDQEPEGSKLEDPKIQESETQTETGHVHEATETEVSSVNQAENEETVTSQEETSPSVEKGETETQGVGAAEEVAHDETEESNIPSVDLTETPVESDHGPSTHGPSFEAEHSIKPILEVTKSPEYMEESVSTEGYNEKGEVPESDNLITDEGHLTNSDHLQPTQEQSGETSDTSSFTLDAKPEPEDDLDKHEPETTENSEHSDSEPSETASEPEQPTQEIDHTPGSPSQEAEQPEHGTVLPPQDVDAATEESTEVISKPHEDGHEEGEIILEEAEGGHEGEMTHIHDDEASVHITETPAEVDIETTHGEGEPVHEESEPIHEEEEQTGHTEEETVQGGETVHEDTEPGQEENEPAHEVPIHEEEETAHEPETPEHETDHSVSESEQTVPESEQVSESEHPTQEPEHETEHSVPESEQVSESEHPTQEPEHETEHSVSESEHPVEEPVHDIHETEHSPQVPDNIIQESEHPVEEPDHPIQEPEVPIEEPEHPVQESEHVVVEPEQTIHEAESTHTQDPGSLQASLGGTQTIEDSKPDHNKPDDTELPSEDQFTPDVDMDYDVSEDGAFGPGTCRYGGKVYVSAQQIPRDDPCDFCFCFRSDIICLQQSCPPPIHRCHQEPIQGYCCPRYQCPVSMATSLNLTTTTSTTTTTLPPHFFAHAYHGAARQSGCFHKGRAYEVGQEMTSASGPCLHCLCGSDGQMRCDPKVCNPEPMVRKLMEAAVSHRRR